MIKKGIAIRVIGGNGDGTFVVNEHFKAYKKSKNGIVTFSTDIQISSNRAPELDSMIMYVAEKDIYVLAQIKDICVNSKPFIPEDKKFIESSPDRYRKEKRSWIIISDMKIINKDEIEGYYVLYDINDDGEYKKVALDNVFRSSERIARVYYNYISEENDDEFILIK